MTKQEMFIQDLKEFIDARIRCSSPEQDNEHFYTSHIEENTLLASLDDLLKGKKEK